MYNKIINPNTGRKVKINSILGKSILKKYLSTINFVGGASSFTPEVIPLGWQYAVGDSKITMEDPFPFRSFWLIKIQKEEYFKDMFGEKLMYLPIYISSGTNSPITFLPLPFHGFISSVQSNNLLSYIMKTNTLRDIGFRTLAKFPLGEHPTIPNLEYIIKQNNNKCLFGNIVKNDIQKLVDNIRDIMGLSNKEISNEDFESIKDKVGSYDYLSEMLDGDYILNSNYKNILEVHRSIKNAGEKKIKDNKDTSSINMEDLVIKTSREIQGNFSIPLIEDLKILNKMIAENKASIFGSKYPSIDSVTIEMYRVLETFIDTNPSNLTLDDAQIIKGLYPHQCRQQSLNDKALLTVLKNFAHSKAPAIKRRQIINSVRLDDILNFIDGLGIDAVKY